MKRKLSQGLLPDRKLLKKIFPKILEMRITNKVENYLFKIAREILISLYLNLKLH